MNYYWIGLLLLFGSLPAAQSQYHEVGAALGVSNYLGDLVPPQTYFLGTNISAGLQYQFNINPHFAVRSGITLGKLSGNDQNSDYDSGRRQRNLQFESPLLEIGAMGQIYILPFHPNKEHHPISPYIFAGVALFHFNPYTTYKSEQIYLQPLGTEGQGIDGYAEKYALWGWAIPFGGGVKFNINRQFNIAVEVGCRKTFTDYIDDVSGDYVDLATLRQGNGLLAAELSNRTYNENGIQIERVGQPRGHSGKDWYIISQIGVSYTLQNRYYFKPKRKKKHAAPKKKNTGRWM